MKEDAGRRRGMKSGLLFCAAMAALLALLVMACSFRTWHTNQGKSPPTMTGTEPNHDIGIDIQQYPRITLTKRAPVLYSELFDNSVGRAVDLSEIARERQSQSGLMTRSLEAFEMMRPSGRPHTIERESSSVSKTAIGPFQVPVGHLIFDHPKIQRLDQKRRVEHMELQQSDLQVKKAKAQRNAILQHKPERKSEKGKRVSELTMSNISLAKAAFVKKVDQIQAIRTENKLQKEVKKVQEQGAALD